MPSFDIVSKIDLSELKNAVLNSMKEISQRYDFKGSISKIELENDYLIIHTEDDLKAKQVNDILLSNLVRRKIDPKSLKEFKKENASGNSIRILFSIVDGIDKEDAKKLISLLERMNCKLNIIPYNEIGGHFERPSDKKIEKFIKVLKNVNFPVTVRWSKGTDIDAGCGQLVTSIEA